MRIALLPQKVIPERTNVGQGMQHHVAVVVGLNIVQAHNSG